MDLLEKITIVVYVKDRQDRLKRLLEYLEPYNLNVIIADGTHEIFKYKDDYSIKYLHFPNSPENICSAWYQGIVPALNMVKTKYVMMGNDDDFMRVDFLPKKIKFLDEHDDFVSVGSREICYKYFTKDKKISYTDIAYKNAPTQYSKINIFKRIESFKNFKTSHNNIVRADIFKDAVKLIAKANIREPIVIEIALHALLLINGRTKEMNDIGYAREGIKGSLGEESSFDTLIKLYEKNHKSILKSKALIEKYAIEKKISKKDAKQISESAISNIVKYCKKLHKINSPLKFPYLESSKLKKKYKFISQIDYLVKKYGIDAGFDYEVNKNYYSISKNINIFYRKINDFFTKHNDKKFIIYGGGVVGKITTSLYSENIDFLVDKNAKADEKIFGKNIFHPEKILKYKNNPILITVLGREKSIKKYLKDELKVKNKIYTFSF